MSTTTANNAVQVPLLDLKGQYASIKNEIDAAIKRVVDSQHFILGPEVVALEEEIAAYSHTKYGIGMSSGTDALLAALMAVNIGVDDEVITTPYTFFATAGTIARLGAKPVFVDIDPVTFNIDPNLIAAAVTPKTKAIVPVHLYGRMADMDPIMAIAREHNLTVIEDAAQSIGSFDAKGRQSGSIGDMGCFSFFPSKNLGGFGDGGMTVTQDGALAQRLKMMRMHGMEPKYYHSFVGGNFRLDALQAAVLRVKLEHLPEWSNGRRRNAARYRELFAAAGLDGIKLPQDEPGHIYNQFVIRTPNRDGLQAYLKEHGVGTEVYYPLAMHQQECFAYLNCGSFPESEKASKETLALPVYPELTDEQLQRVVTVIGDYMRRGV
jgi:dTDP-4-amino-4,6-dideoxygalactose transaminase